MFYYADETVQKLINEKELAVFGAGNVARLIVRCLIQEPYSLHIACCMVSDIGKNPKEICGIPVIDYTGEEAEKYKNRLVIVAMAEKNLGSVMQDLQNHGFEMFLPVTYECDLWSLLRGNCYRDYRLSRHKPYLTLEEELSREEWNQKAAGNGTEEKIISVYRACSHVDRELGEDLSRFSWEIPIQVGTALTEQRICEICDNVGDNISEKNRRFCELTALYWIWKNDRSDYVGLGHYRRHFELNERQLRQIAGSDIDVVLTIPIMDDPDVHTVYRRDHVGEDWDVMVDAVREMHPEYLQAVEEMGRGRFYYAYNMFIMRRGILENYCEWLFPILAYCEMHCREKEDIYQNRYIGFLAEHLMSAYFTYHENEYKIVHARKHFIA